MHLDDHLARHRLADLFLDTLPYNAHTTASDALWAGLPLLTCTGSTFPGRVAGSLLHAIGLPELITHSLRSMRRSHCAWRRRRTSWRRCARSWRRTARRARYSTRTAFRRHIESAYVTMWERCQRGAAPESFSVAAKDFTAP